MNPITKYFAPIPRGSAPPRCDAPTTAFPAPDRVSSATVPPTDTNDDDDDTTSSSDLSDGGDDGYTTEAELLRTMGLSPASAAASSADSDAVEDWDDESLLEDAVDQMMAGDFADSGDEHGEEVEELALEKRVELKAFLRKVGEEGFIREVVYKQGMKPRTALTAFGVRTPRLPENAYLNLLHVVLGREMIKRTRIPEVNCVEHVVRLLRESRNIVVLTGAGISTSLGIPDFRSKGSGLYSRLEGLGLSDPQEVFDIQVFTDDPNIFYSIAKDILPTAQKFSPTHAFIALLQQKQKLLTQYTQNIDNLEMLAGIDSDKLIQCHGSFASASCVKCKHRVAGENIFPELRKGVIAKCERCLKLLSETSAAGKKRKRQKSSEKWTKKRFSEDSSAEEEEMNFREAGVMKPDITFFGEQLPDTFHKRLVDHDRDKADLLVCIGTSLKVAPVSEIIGFLPPHVPQIYISKTPVNHIEFDVELLGSCDEVMVELCRMAGWEFEHEMIPKPRPEMKIERLEGKENRFAFEVKG